MFSVPSNAKIDRCGVLPNTDGRFPHNGNAQLVEAVLSIGGASIQPLLAQATSVSNTQSAINWRSAAPALRGLKTLCQ
jgi:hypothetical protein